MQTNEPRRPGELLFNLAMLAASLFLFYSAWRISGFEALSAPGAVPMVATGTMALCAALIVADSLRKSGVTGETFWRQILPVPVVVTVVMITAYALALRPLGFLPTSLLFLWVLIRYFTGRSLGWSLMISVMTVAIIWVVFRMIFTVLMPEGIVPEREIIAFVRNLLSGRGN
ncbi:MAG TPA: tripartite tricarboxylate transporter TctB family protein [Paracoccaceae bacterium]|nr:tripartite tricarboxylate transporter TctB family protein [Paracoccaceae bacterium]HMO71795.1 tripartite tricarboxylate transporter TctB family protein [Paracoccaceae bacterium]